MIVAFCGPSNSGKTTFIEEIIKAFGDKYSIAVIKHTPHQVDVKGKDSFRFIAAGADEVILVGEKLVRFQRPLDIKELLRNMNYDLILIEGFKNLTGVTKVCLGNTDCIECTFKNPAKSDVLKYIEREIAVEKIMKKLPNFNCGECGFRDCRGMAEMILEGKSTYDHCRYWNGDSYVKLVVNGKNIYLGKFAQKVVYGTIMGLIGALKDVKNPEKIQIYIER